MRRTRVTMVSKLYPPWVGGLESHVAQLSEQITADDPSVRVSVVAGQERWAGGIDEVRAGVRVLRARTIARVARTPVTVGLSSLIRRTRPDLLHFHAPFPWGELVAPLRDVRIPVVVTYYHDVIRQRTLRHLYRPVLDRLLRRADRVIAWSPHLVESSPVLSRFRDKTVVIPGGIDTARFLPSPESRRRAALLRRRLAPEGPLVLFVGRLVYYKGVEYLLRAMRELPGSLAIVGSGALGPSLQRLARELRMGSRVHFAGSVPDQDLPLYYQAADLLVLPSCAHTESFGLVQLEAHASGIPSICTDLPTGVTFANPHGETGLVVPARDSGSLAAAIAALLHDGPGRARLGARAQARAVAEFDLRRCAARVLDLYRELLSSPTVLAR